jgi:hypothetical protein
VGAAVASRVAALTGELASTRAAKASSDGQVAALRDELAAARAAQSAEAASWQQQVSRLQQASEQAGAALGAAQQAADAEAAALQAQVRRGVVVVVMMVQLALLSPQQRLRL